MMNWMIALPLLLGFLAVGCGKKDGADGAAPSASGATSAAAGGGVLEKIKEVVSNELTIQQKAPAVGSKARVEKIGESTMVLKMKGREMNFVEKTVSRRTEEVLAVDGNTVTKLKVSYEVSSKDSQENGKSRKKPDLLAGKTFLLEFAAGKVAVTSEDKKPVPGPAKQAVLKDFKNFGKPDKVQAALNGKTLKIGDPVAGLDEVLSEQIKDSIDDPRTALAVETPKITLKRKEGDFAVFELKVAARSTKGMMKGLVIDTTSELFVHLTDSRSGKGVMSGTMALTPEEQAKNKDLSLSGSIKEDSSSTPL